MSFVAVPIAIAKVTFREIIRDRILYNVIMLGFLLMGVGFFASRLTFVRPERVVLDFGVSAVNLSCALIAAFSGAAVLLREYERRTVYLALSRPISRLEFVAGKFGGLAAVITLNWAFVSFLLVAVLLMTGTSGGEFVTGSLGMTLLLLLFQSWVIGVFAIFFSTFSTTSLSAAMTIGVYLLGNNVSQIALLVSRVQSPVTGKILKAFASFLPNFESFNVGLQVTYGIAIAPRFFLGGFLYAGVLITLGLSLSGMLIRGREI